MPMPESPNWISTGLFTCWPFVRLMKYTFAPGADGVCAQARPAAIVTKAAAAKIFKRILFSSALLHALGQLALVILVEELRQHARGNAVSFDHVLPIGAHFRILHPIGDRGAAFGNVHRRVVDMLLTR